MSFKVDEEAVKIKEKIYNAFPVVRDSVGSIMTAMELHRATGIKLNSLSSALNKMSKRGQLQRIKGYGPRGGFGYRLVSVADAIMNIIQQRSVQEICEKIDAEVLKDLRGV